MTTEIKSIFDKIEDPEERALVHRQISAIVKLAIKNSDLDSMQRNILSQINPNALLDWSDKQLILEKKLAVDEISGFNETMKPIIQRFIDAYHPLG